MVTYAVQGGFKVQLGPVLVAANGWFGRNTGNVFGNLSMNLNNGNDTVSVVNSPFGTFFINAGNGNSSVSLAPVGASNPNWTVNWTFGTGSNTINLGGTEVSTLFGSIFSQAAANGTSTNVFTQGANWTLQLSTFVF